MTKNDGGVGYGASNIGPGGYSIKRFVRKISGTWSHGSFYFNEAVILPFFAKKVVIQYKRGFTSPKLKRLVLDGAGKAPNTDSQ